MKAEELRIGNKAYLNGLDIDSGNWNNEVIDISYRDIYNLINGHDVVKDAYSPIPLTEKWLLKLGFKDDIDVNGERHIRCGKILLNEDFFLRYSDTNDDYFYSTSIKIKYVHQLQNLYFCLTGEELQIEINKLK